jgi:hypothetical protein
MTLPGNTRDASRVAQLGQFRQTSSIFDSPASTLGATVAAMIDTFGTSLGILDDNDVQKFLNEQFPAVGKTLEENRQTIGAIADIAGAFIPGAIAMKAVRTTGFLGKLAHNTLGANAARYLTSTGLTNQKLFAANFQRARVLASKGARRIDDDAILRAMNRRKLGKSVHDVVLENLAADAAIVGSMHESDFLFPDEISMVENLMWFGGFNAAFGLAAAMAARYTLKRGILVAAGSVADAAQNPKGLPRNQLQSNVLDERGPAVSVLGAFLTDIAAQVRTADAQGNPDAIKNAIAAQDATEARLSELFTTLFKDSPITGITTAHSINPRQAPELSTALTAIKRDEFAFQGVRALEPFQLNVVETFTDKINIRVQALAADISTLSEEVKRLEKQAIQPGSRREFRLARKRQKLQNKQDQLSKLHKTAAVVYELDGSTVGNSKRADIFQDGERNFSRFRGLVTEANVEGRRLRVDSDARIDFPSGTFTLDELENIDDSVRQFLNTDEFIKLSHVQKTAVHDLMQDLFERIERTGVADWEGMQLKANSHHSQFDFAARLADRFGSGILSKIRGVEDVDEILYAGLSSKFREFQILRNQAEDAIKAGKPHIYEDLDNLAKALNLPGDSHAILQLFMENRVDGKIMPLNVIADTMDDFRAALRSNVGGTAADTLAPDLKFMGNMQQLPRDGKPFIGLLKNDEVTTGITRDNLREHTAAVRDLLTTRLRASNTLLVRGVLNALEANPEALRAAKNALPAVIQGINFDTIQKQFVTQAFRLREVDAARPLDLLADLSQKTVDKGIETLLNSPSTMFADDGSRPLTHQEVFNRILNRSSSTSQGDLLNFFVARNAIGNGWDIAEEVAITGKGGARQYQMKLVQKSERNRALWRELFGEEMPLQAMLPSGPNSRVPVTMTELAFRTVQSFDDLSQTYLREQNALRVARGQKPIKSKRFHLPPKDLSQAHKTFLLDSSGQPRVVVGGATARMSRDAARKEIANSDIPLFAVDESNMQMYFEARGRAFFEMSDFSKPSNLTGPSKGKSFGATVEAGPAELQRMLESLLRGFTDIGRETRLAVFEPEVQFLKLQKASAGIGVKETKNESNIFDLLINRIVGTQNISAESIPGKLLIGFEGAYDKLMQRMFDKLSDSRPRFGASAQFQQFSEQLEPQHNPFRNFNDFLEKTAKVTLPPELRRHAGALNEITTALSIRVLDVGMGVINMASLASTLPPVIRMLQKLPTESGEQHLNRIAAWGAASPEGLAYFSPTRAVISGTHFMFSQEGKQVARRAAEAGYFDQFAAEQVEIYARTGEKFMPGLLRSLSTKASIITDKTERYARAVSWMTMYNIGKKGLKLQDEAAMAFAHSQANNVIADFRPSNRPVVFQGAAGMPFGLFTSFMWNYLQRMYSIVETKNMGALINQVGLQATFFGAESVPGVNKALETLGTVYGDGSENLADRAHRAFGPSATEFMLNGALAHFSGVSVTPRAAIGLPGEQGFGLERQIASFRMVGRLWDTFWNEIKIVQEEERIDPGQMAEVLARANINKGISNIIELVQGRGLDARGNIIEEFKPIGEVIADPIEAIKTDARTRIAVGARALGFKPLVADELRQENRRNRTTDRIRNELKDRLSESLRSKIRRGRLSGRDVERALSHYVRAGGNPANFKRYFASQIARGTQNKLDREIADALKTSADKNRIARLLFLASEE